MRKKLVKGFSLIETIFFIIVVTIAMGIFADVHFFFTCKNPQILEHSRMFDLAVSCTERIKYAKSIKQELAPSICQTLVEKNENYAINTITLESGTNKIIVTNNRTSPIILENF